MSNRSREPYFGATPLPGIFLGLVVTAIIGIELIYARGWNNRFVSDDWKFLYVVSTMQSPRDLLSLFNFDFWGFVRPIQYVVTYLLYSVFYLDPVPYHLAMQMLDLANALMLGIFAFQAFSVFGVFEKKAMAGMASAGVSVFFLFSWRHHEALYWYSGGE